MTMNVSIKELGDLTTNARNAAIEEAAKILDEEADWFAVNSEKTENQREGEDYATDYLLCQSLAEKIRNLKRE